MGYVPYGGQGQVDKPLYLSILKCVIAQRKLYVKDN